MKQHILVAGAGIVGVSCAIWLQRMGHQVTLVDRTGPAAGASHGNAGVLASGAIIPVNTPGLIWEAPKMLLSPMAPLFVRWSYLPRMLPFLAKFLSYARKDFVDYSARAMSSLLYDSVAQHRALAQGTEAEKYISDEDFCFGYTNQAQFAHDRSSWDQRKDLGVEFETVTGAEFAQYDPLYEGAFETVVRCKSHGRISDPGAYVKALVDHFCQQGGEFVICDIEDIQMHEGEVQALHTSQGVLSGDHIVLATGAYSKPLAQKLGLKLPLESERGYHVELINPSQMPRAPMMVAAGKFVITPMQGRIRAAGIVEFGGLKLPASKAPLRLMHKLIQQTLPNIEYDDVQEWMGHRPTLATSLPLIGPTSENANSHVAFGHQHVGLTGGAKTGRIIADLIAHKQPNIDLSPFDPGQFQ